MQPNEIGVAVKDGVVTLTGWVDAYTKKWAAEEAAHRVRGVKAVANDIEVRLPSSPSAPTPTSPPRRPGRSNGTRSLPIEELDVTVSKGWVTLSGEVEWQYQKREAERVVRRLSGVRGVTNLITVRPRVKTTPESCSRGSRTRWCAAPRRTPSRSRSRSTATRSS